jgi:hypothetical protein
MNRLRAQIQAAFTGDFCRTLEHHLCRAFENCDDKKYRWLGCDGVDVPDMANQPTQKPGSVFTMAWFGATGQDRYKMTIKLGGRAIENCRKGLGLEDCLPDKDSLDWVTLDLENREIVLRLK